MERMPLSNGSWPLRQATSHSKNIRRAYAYFPDSMSQSQLVWVT